MKKMMITAMVSLLMSGAASAAGFGLEADRAEAGRKFDEARLSAPLAVQITGEFQRGADAKYTGEARDYTKLAVKAPPLPEAGAAEGGEEISPAPAPAPAAGGAMMSGISGLKLAVILTIAAVVVLLVLSGGASLAAISPAGTAALFVAGAVAVGAITGHHAETPADPAE